MKELKKFLFLCCLIPALAAAAWSCSDECGTCPDCGVEEDVTADETADDVLPDPVEEQDAEDAPEEVETRCILPEVLCEAGQHPEYGLCVDDTEIVAVPAGGFTMGTDGGEDNPTHTVNLAAFSIDKYEITNRKYQSCVEAGCCTPPQHDGSYTGRQPYYGNPDYDNYPVIFVTWDQAREYCENLGKALPTEAQWEKAARSDDGRTYPWGDGGPNSTLANFNLPINGDTMEVGTHSDGASPYGAEDMAGNVWEWVSDWYDVDYYSASPTDDPLGPDDGTIKGARGGSFASLGTSLRSYLRGSYHPMEVFSTLGFRCVTNE
jgi:formylglycine-generating enzyme required for sulfatase activity